MTDFLSKPRFQIPSARELMQARLLKRLRDNEHGTTELKFALTVEHHRRARQHDKPQARHKMQQAIESKLNQHRAEAYAFYRSVLKNPNATVHEQLFARARIDKLLGLDTE